MGPTIHGVFDDASGDGGYLGYIRPSVKVSATHSVHASFSPGNGLIATYYDDFAESGSSSHANNYFHGLANGFRYPESGNVNDPSDVSGGFRVRWEGFIRPSLSQQYTFEARFHSSDERVRLWIDSELLVDQWDSLSVHGGSSGDYFVHSKASPQFDVSNGYYDIVADYAGETGGGDGSTNFFELKWINENVNSGNALTASQREARPRPSRRAQTSLRSRARARPRRRRPWGSRR